MVNRVLNYTIFHHAVYLLPDPACPHLASTLPLTHNPPLFYSLPSLKQVPINDGVRIVMIDGFGSSEFVPFSRWFDVLGRKKVERKVRRFQQRYHVGECTQ